MSAAAAVMPQSPRYGAGLLNVLIVDDERAIQEGCREVAEGMGFHAHTAGNAAEAYRLLEAHGADIVVLDWKLPGAGGLEVIQEVRRRRPHAAVIVISGYANVTNAVAAMKQGVYDFLPKPFHGEELRLLFERAAAEIQLSAENRAVREMVKQNHQLGKLIGRAPEMEKLFRIIAKVARSSHPVLVLGESGTGKELVARSIHDSGPNHDKPFIPVDCGSLVPTLIESELFGYVKGAFTGAARSKEGLMSIAEGGTVFLDEIGELPVDLQSKLLRALQEREIRPVGATKAIPLNVRILAATNRDLEQAVQAGVFRRDLYFRLNVVSLRIPPLRERREDIPLLAAHFLERHKRMTGVDHTLSDDALQRMVEYEWPGNVRELENCLERACALSSGPALHVADLPTQLQNFGLHGLSPQPENDGVVPIAELEKNAILTTLRKVEGDKIRAARLLGIGKTTLYRKLKEYGMPAH